MFDSNDRPVFTALCWLCVWTVRALLWPLTVLGWWVESADGPVRGRYRLRDRSEWIAIIGQQVLGLLAWTVAVWAVWSRLFRGAL
jgi:hypothetical protein